MKLIIDIPEEVYQHMMGNDLLKSAHGNICYKAVLNGTPIPDNATNGDVIKAMFPNTEIMITDERVFLRDETIVMIYSLTWWDAPYCGFHIKGANR